MAELEGAKLRPGHEQAQGPQRVGQAGMRASRLCLTFERPDLPLDLSDQVEESLEVLLRRGEAPLGPLAAAAVLEHSGRLLDDRPAILRAGLQDGVEMALADDDVLLAAHARIREQLLDVEEPARRAVDRVLAVARSEQRPGDGDLGEVGAELAEAVIDGEGHLRPTEGGAVGRAHEDDVLHLRRAHGPWPLCPQHPCDGVDHVRLAAPVGTHDHRDARFEFKHGRIGERLEPLEGE